MNKYECIKCDDELDEDDTVWANGEGNIEIPAHPFCVTCLPAQKASY